MNQSITKLEQLAQKAMMNPHFIFNVINSIQHYINEGDKDLANFYLADFAKLIRLCSRFSGKRLISLLEELEYLNIYLNFEKLRFGDKLTYNIEVDEEIIKEKTQIAVMLIQPFLENAIWHGILPTGKKGILKLIINKSTEGFLRIEIVDDGIGIDKSFIGKNLLENPPTNLIPCLAIQRLKLQSSNSSTPLYLKYNHLFARRKHKGTRVEFLLPVLNEFLKR